MKKVNSLLIKFGEMVFKICMWARKELYGNGKTLSSTR